MRRTGIMKLGAAAVAAGAGVILAITSVMAHTSQATALHVPTQSSAASIMATVHSQQKAAEAAALLAAEQAKAAKLAAKLKFEAAVAAEEANESTGTEANEDGTSVTETDTDNETDTDTDTDTQEGPDAQDETPDATEPADTESD